MVTKIYIDTSIVGGFFDKEFAAETRALFEQLKNKEVIFILSDDKLWKRLTYKKSLIVSK